MCHPLVYFQVSTGESIYLVSKQSSVFGSSSSGDQYLSHESRSSRLLWLPSAIPNPSLSLSISFACAFSPPCLLSPSRSLSPSSLFLSVFFFLLYTHVFFLPHSSWKMTLSIWTALNAHYIIRPCVDLIKNRSKYWVRTSQDFSASRLPSLSTDLYRLMLGRYEIRREMSCLCADSFVFYASSVIRDGPTARGAVGGAPPRVWEARQGKASVSTWPEGDTDERPLHHLNGIHKPLNQYVYHGFGKKKWKKKKTHTLAHQQPQSTYTHLLRSEKYTVKTEQWCLKATLKLSGGSVLHLVRAGFRVAGPLGSGTESKCPAVH